MTKKVTITLAGEPDYTGSPRAFNGVSTYPNTVCAIALPYQSSFAKKRYPMVLAYLQSKYGITPVFKDYSEHVFKKIKQRNPNWQKRKKQGEIVFAPYYNGRLNAGFNRKTTKRVVSSLRCNDTNAYLPYQVKPFPNQAIGVWDKNQKVCSLWPKHNWWVPGEGVLPQVAWNHNIEIEERTTYTEWVKSSMLGKLSYGGDLIDDDLITQTLAELNQKEVDILTEVMEIAETANTIMTQLKRLASLLFKFKKSVAYLVGVPNKTKELAKLWLEYRYGIRPIIYSVESCLRVLDDFGKSDYVRAKKKKVITRPSPLNKDITESLELRCIIKRRYDTRDLIGELGSKFISADPLLTAWELTSFSFIVNWVLDIGSFISAINVFQPNYHKQQEACFSIKAKCDGSTDAEFLDYEVYQRHLIEPQSHITIPIQNTLDLQKITDLASLAKVLFGDYDAQKNRGNNVHGLSKNSTAK